MARAKSTRPLVSSAPESEVEAYHFIRQNLRELGWIVRSPSRYEDGQVWTQNQCLEHPLIKSALGLTRPENIVRLSETKLWVIEAKSERSALGRALREAEHDYAKPINKTRGIRAVLISGVAGNDASGYEVRSRLLVRGRYEPVTINGVEATGLLDPATVDVLLTSGDPDVADYQVNEDLFLRTAEQINGTLHNGGINKNDRSRVMAALLLALVDKSSLDLDSDLPVLIEDINNRTKAVLSRHKKKEFHPFVRIEPPTSAESHVKYKLALVRTIQQLHNLNIKSAMNSGTDVLGRFYEVFLRYGNGAKEIGIVLTPRHVTRFAVDTIGVSVNDLVLDPACGTGGFLVAAFDHVRARTSGPALERFKKNNLFGIEQDPAVAALAIVNMIFRGDGKNNIIEGNCFTNYLTRTTQGGNATAEYVRNLPSSDGQAITRVFMNPPFALKKSDEHEWHFVDAALKSMMDGGLLFAIVPMSVVTEGGGSGAWRKLLLAHHTVEAVISFPEELFYPVANQTVAIVLRKGVAHRPNRNILWARIVDDGYRKSKGKRLPTNRTNHLDELAPVLRTFIDRPSRSIPSVPERMRVAPIDPTDPILELAPEVYLDSHVPTREELNRRLDAQVRENIEALVGLDLRSPSLRRTIIDEAIGSKRDSSITFPKAYPSFSEFQLSSLFVLRAGDYHSLTDIEPGDIPVASCADTNNGIAGLYTVPKAHIVSNALTIAFNGSPLTTKLHPYQFAAKDDVAIATPCDQLLPEALIFIQAQLNSERWRFSYYRKCFREKLGRTTVELPVKGNGELDVEFMVAAVRAQPYWWFLAPRLKHWTPITA